MRIITPRLSLTFIVLLFTFSSTCFSQTQQWTKKPNVAQYKGANWKNEITRASNISLEKAFQIAESDPRITFFFYMKSSMFLEGKPGPKGYTQKGRFKAKDAVFFSGKPWFGGAKMADGYVKNTSKAEPNTPSQEDPKTPIEPEIEIKKEEKSTLLKFEDINFQKGTSKIFDDYSYVIDKVAEHLASHPSIQIQITGHTDNTGSKELNEKLSRERADKIKKLLEEKGVSSNRITTIGYGPRYPIGDNKTEEGKAKNRRIEFRVPNNLIVNGGFEEPQLKNKSWKSLKTIPGWNEKNNRKVEIQNNVAGKAIEGNQLMELDANKNTSIYQTIRTKKNQTYILSFCFAARPNTTKQDNILEVYWNGKKIDTIHKKGGKSCEWETYQFKLTSKGKKTNIEFRDAGKSNGLGTYLDNVTLYPIFLNK